MSFFRNFNENSADFLAQQQTAETQPAAVRTPRFAQALHELRSVKGLTGSAVFTALNVLLNQVAIPVSNMLEIGFAFLATAGCAFMYGPFAAALMGGIADILGYFLRPNGGFFPGFTLNEIVAGLIYGFWLYKKPVSLGRTVCACLCVVIVVNFFMTPLWLHIMYGKAFVITGLRIVKNVIKLPVDVAMLYTVLKLCEAHGLRRAR